MKKPHQKGFTITEVMIVIAIGVISLAAGAYTFVDWTQNQLGPQLASQMYSALRLARSEALRRATTVSVCAASDTALTACASLPSNWNSGWIVFTDADSSGAINGADVIIQVFPISGARQNITFSSTTSPYANYATFNSLGFATKQVNINFKPTGCSGSHGKNLLLAGSGRVTLTTIDCP